MKVKILSLLYLQFGNKCCGEYKFSSLFSKLSEQTLQDAIHLQVEERISLFATVSAPDLWPHKSLIQSVTGALHPLLKWPEQKLTIHLHLVR
jgi:hypothetical protein